jgi:hypothetical protein
MDLRRIAADGLIAGLIGYAAVVVVFAAIGVIGGRSPFTIAALLGSALFRSAANGAVPTVEPGIILAYNGVHLAIFLVAGFFMAWLAALSERAPQAWYPMAIIALFVGIHVFALPIWFDERVRTQLSLWTVGAVTILAAVLMGAFLWRSRPGIRAAAHEPDGGSSSQS